MLSLALRSKHQAREALHLYSRWRKVRLFDFPLLGHSDLRILKSRGRNSLYHHLSSLTSESVPLTKTENVPVCKAGVKQEPQEEEQSKPPARGGKTLSSFFSEHLSLSVPLGCAGRRSWALFRLCWLDKAWEVGTIRSKHPLLPIFPCRPPEASSES